MLHCYAVLQTGVRFKLRCYTVTLFLIQRVMNVTTRSCGPTPSARPPKWMCADTDVKKHMRLKVWDMVHIARYFFGPSVAQLAAYPHSTRQCGSGCVPWDYEIGQRKKGPTWQHDD